MHLSRIGLCWYSTHAAEPNLKCMRATHFFTFSGQRRQLSKHPTVRLALARGELTDAQAKLRPWYLRTGGSAIRLSARDAEAVRQAREILRAQRTRPTDWQAFVAAKDAARSVTIGKLAADWFADGLPHSKTQPRTRAQADRLRSTLARCLPWWTARRIAEITPQIHEDYVAHRQQHHARGTGERIADLELAALSSLCQWGIGVGRIVSNPFAHRKRFAQVARHCHQHTPADDETLHRVLAWLYDQPEEQLVIAAGWLTLCALTGLRPGEPRALLRLPVLDAPSGSLAALQPGQIFRTPDGALRMRIVRLKNGQNPAVLIHPAAESFVAAWRAWHSRHCPDEEKLFPLLGDTTSLNRALARAGRALDLPTYKPHGFGRAYYVRVRRSQGADDATIAGELGQTTNGALIRSTYGDPDDMLGGALYDWLPAPPTRPAWDLLCLSMGPASTRLLGVRRNSTKL